MIGSHALKGRENFRIGNISKSNFLFISLIQELDFLIFLDDIDLFIFLISILCTRVCRCVCVCKSIRTYAFAPLCNVVYVRMYVRAFICVNMHVWVVYVFLFLIFWGGDSSAF